MYEEGGESVCVVCVREKGFQNNDYKKLEKTKPHAKKKNTLPKTMIEN